MNRILLKNNSGVTFSERPGLEFNIDKLIGRGSSCVVYHAVCSDNTEHLLKEYYPKHLEIERNTEARISATEKDKDAFEQGLRRFQGGCERQMAIRLSNENLKNFTCNVQGYYKANGTEYIDMTCFNGQTYNNVQEKSVYDLALRMRTLTQVVGNYHKAGLLHLDIKPENIYVRPTNETVEDVMLFDFDSVVAVDDVRTSKALSCTKTWAAPEQLLADKRKVICPATDLFAIGEIIFIQLFGRHSTQAERRSFVKKYEYDYEAGIFKDMNPKVFELLNELLSHTICSVVSKRYQSDEELIAKLDEIIKLADPKEAYLKSSLPAVQNFFIGREDEIGEIHKKLSENNILFLKGIGGIGKSELAKQYARTYKKDYDVIIFAPYVNDVSMLIQDDVSIPVHNFHKYPEETSEEYCVRKLCKLQELCDERTLFIVDNLDSDEDKDITKLFDLQCKVLITTRMDFSDYGYGQQLNLDAIKNRQEVRSIFDKYYTKALTDEEDTCVDDIIDFIDSHTMTVELFAKQMMAGRVTPNKMLAKLQEGGISESGKEKVRMGKDGILVAQSAYAHIQTLFDLSELEEEEKYVLANLSLIPYTGISTELFHNWCELEDYEAINRLVVEGWIRLDEEKDYISLHPVVCDLCIIKLCNIKNTTVMIERIIEFITEKKYFSGVEVEIYSNIFISIINKLRNYGIESSRIAYFSWKMGEFLSENTFDFKRISYLKEYALDWEYGNRHDTEMLELMIRSYLLELRNNIISFEFTDEEEMENKTKIIKWQGIYESLNVYANLECNESQTGVSAIEHFSKIQRHFRSIEDLKKVKEYAYLIVNTYETLTDSQIDNLLMYVEGCENIVAVAESYFTIDNTEKSLELCNYILKSSVASIDTRMCMWNLKFRVLLELEDYITALSIIEEFRIFLVKNYPIGHKEYTHYYMYAFLFHTLKLTANDEGFSLIPPSKFEELFSLYDNMLKFCNQFYKEIDFLKVSGVNFIISGFAHMLLGYVSIYLTNSIIDDEDDEKEVWNEMTDEYAHKILQRLKEIYLLLGEEEMLTEINEAYEFMELKNSLNILDLDDEY